MLAVVFSFAPGIFASLGLSRQLDADLFFFVCVQKLTGIRKGGNFPVLELLLSTTDVCGLKKILLMHSFPKFGGLTPPVTLRIV